MHRHQHRFSVGPARRLLARGFRAARGFSLVEALVAMAILTVGLLGLAAVFTKALTQTTAASGDILAKDKAFEAIESILAARDNKMLTWEHLNNTSTAGGKFPIGYLSIKGAGQDSILGTQDDVGDETIRRPGPDDKLGTDDDVDLPMGNYKRRIVITNDNNSDTLRRIEVTVQYTNAAMRREYKVTTLITSFGVGQ